MKENLYELIYPDLEDDRVCRDISDSACHDAPKNFFWNLSSGMASKLAEQLAGPSVVLAWTMAALGAPHYLIGLLQPIKEAGSMLPQLFIAGRIRAYQLRKKIWVSAALIQALSLLLLGLILVIATPSTQVIAILIALLVFSIASGIASVSFSDVLGKTIPRGARGQLLGKRGSIGGLLTLLASIFLHFYLGDDSSIAIFTLLIFIAAGLWVISSFCFSQIEELPGQTKGGKSAVDELSAGISLLKSDRGFFSFLISRSFLLSITLSIPFFTLHARELSDGNLRQIGGILFALALSQILSSPFWGKFSDASARKVMFASGAMAIVASAGALTLDKFNLEPSSNAWAYLVIFFVLGIAQAGARIGRKTYLVDYAPKDERPRYVAVANTWMGLITILGSSLGILASLVGLQQLIAWVMVCNFLGILATWQMTDLK